MQPFHDGKEKASKNYWKLQSMCKETIVTNHLAINYEG